MQILFEYTKSNWHLIQVWKNFVYHFLCHPQTHTPTQDPPNIHHYYCYYCCYCDKWVEEIRFPFSIDRNLYINNGNTNTFIIDTLVNWNLPIKMLIFLSLYIKIKLNEGEKLNLNRKAIQEAQVWKMTKRVKKFILFLFVFHKSEQWK